jgi:outer membrane protein, multidrug efflux system
MVVGMALLSSCAHMPKGAAVLPVAVPASYGLATGGEDHPDCWWTAFQDEELNGLVREALGSNFGVQQARHRLEQVQAVALRAGAERIPQLSLEGSAARSRSLGRDATGASVLQTGSQFGLNLAASYELDLWGRVSATKRAAVLDAQTASDSLDTAAMSLVAQISDTWYLLASLESRLALLRGQLESSADQVRLLELRFETGQATAVDVLQQREQLAALRTLEPRLEASLATGRHQLAVLLGRPPQLIDDLDPSGLPPLPALPDAGLPADLLEKRPDVRAALNAVRAENERAAAALADRLPALRLTASAGYAAPDAAELFDNWIWNIVGNLLAPVLDGGRRRAEVERSRAVASERLARCGEVLLNAMREVEDALVNESKQTELIARQAEQHDLARQTLKQARFRYERGLSDYLPVLTALGREQSVARALVAARRDHLSHRIQLYRALGGNWMQAELDDAALNESENTSE